MSISQLVLFGKILSGSLPIFRSDLSEFGVSHMFITYIGYSSLIRCIIGNYFLFSRLSSHFVGGFFFIVQKLFSFFPFPKRNNQKQILLRAMSNSLLPMVSSSFMFSFLKSKSLMHFDLRFCISPVTPTLFTEDTVSTPLYVLAPFVPD